MANPPSLTPAPPAHLGGATETEAGTIMKLITTIFSKRTLFAAATIGAAVAASGAGLKWY